MAVLTTTGHCIPAAGSACCCERNKRRKVRAPNVVWQTTLTVLTDTLRSGGFPEPSSYIDPLSSGANCTRDVPFLQQLGVNAVRVYSVNSSLNHDDCMAALDKAGIYVLLDISLPLNGSIDRSNPAWTTNLQDQYIQTINVFNGYSNVLAYNIGNEVITTTNNTAAARESRSS